MTGLRLRLTIPADHPAYGALVGLPERQRQQAALDLIYHGASGSMAGREVAEALNRVADALRGPRIVGHEAPSQADDRASEDALPAALLDDSWLTDGHGPA